MSGNAEITISLNGVGRDDLPGVMTYLTSLLQLSRIAERLSAVSGLTRDDDRESDTVPGALATAQVSAVTTPAGDRA